MFHIWHNLVAFNKRLGRSPRSGEILISLPLEPTIKLYMLGYKVTQDFTPYRTKHLGSQDLKSFLTPGKHPHRLYGVSSTMTFVSIIILVGCGTLS